MKTSVDFCIIFFPQSELKLPNFLITVKMPVESFKGNPPSVFSYAYSIAFGSTLMPLAHTLGLITNSVWVAAIKISLFESSLFCINTQLHLTVQDTSSIRAVNRKHILVYIKWGYTLFYCTLLDSYQTKEIVFLHFH